MKLKIVGTNEYLRPYIAGSYVFWLKATHGIPVDMTIEYLYNKDIGISWVEYIEEALKNKWSHEQIIRSIEYGLRDAYFNPNNLINGSIPKEQLVIETISRIKIYLSSKL